MPRILRPGAVTTVMIEEATGLSIRDFGSVNGGSVMKKIFVSVVL